MSACAGRWLPILLGLVGIAAATSAEAAAAKLARVFRFEMLHAQVAYLETIVGPPMHVQNPDDEGIAARDYRVDGCEVTAYVSGNEVLSYSLRLTPKCNFSLGDFLGNGYPSTDGLTVAKFAGGAFGANLRAQSSCAYLCGNAADPEVDFTWEGPHAANFLIVVLTISLADGRAAEAAGKWTTVMRQNEGDDYVTETRFNCSDKYDAVAIEAFAKVRVTTITVGYHAPSADYYERSCRQ